MSSSYAWDACGPFDSMEAKKCDAHFSKAGYRALWRLLAEQARAFFG